MNDDKKLIVDTIINYFKDKNFEKTELLYEDNYQLIIAIILSARCHDSMVNAISKDLFRKYPNFHSLANANIEDIKNSIKSITYSNQKADRLKKLGQIIHENFNDQIPKDLETLILLPGIGRKTANVFLSVVYNLPCIAVDTHVNRVSNRLQLVNTDDPLKIEMELSRLFPIEYHNRLNSWFVIFGRYTCKAISPQCKDCPFKNICIKHKKGIK